MDSPSLANGLLLKHLSDMAADSTMIALSLMATVGRDVLHSKKEDSVTVLVMLLCPSCSLPGVVSHYYYLLFRNNTSPPS